LGGAGDCFGAGVVCARVREDYADDTTPTAAAATTALAKQRRDVRVEGFSGRCFDVMPHLPSQ